MRGSLLDSQKPIFIRTNCQLILTPLRVDASCRIHQPNLSCLGRFFATVSATSRVRPSFGKKHALPRGEASMTTPKQTRFVVMGFGEKVDFQSGRKLNL